MSETRAICSNLDFEYELADIPVPHKVVAFVRKWQHILKLLPEHQNARCLQLGDQTNQLLTTWGITERVRQMTAQPAPPPEVVKRVNSKLFSHYLERKLGVHLPYSRVVRNEAELTRALAECPHDWILKHPFGVSGRERMVGRLGVFSQSASGWAKKRFSKGWILLFEPWIEKVAECSFHFEIEANGKVESIGQTQLLTGPAGIHQGNRVGFPVQNSEELQPLAKMAADAVAKEGYWGPLGVDSFSGLLGNDFVLRPLVELNARYSFGRLALALRRWIPEGCAYSWIHSVPAHNLEPLGNQRPTEGIYRLPSFVDPENDLDSAIVVSSSIGKIKEFEKGLQATT